MSNEDRFAYEVRSGWSGHRTLWTFVKGWTALIAVLGLLLAFPAGSLLVGLVAALFFWPLPMVYAGPLLLLAAFEKKRIRVVLARDADAWVIETETDLGTKVRRGALSELRCAEVGHEGAAVVLVERGGRRHGVLEPGGRFAYPHLLTIARGDEGGEARPLPDGWRTRDLVADVAMRVNAYLTPGADPDAVRPLRR